MTAPYASVDYARNITGAVQATNGGASINEAKLMGNLRAVSRRVDNVFNVRRPMFLPYKATRRFLLDPMRINSALGTFRIDGHLLALTSVDVAGSTVTDVEGYPNADMPPFGSLQLTDCCSGGWYGYCSSSDRPRRATIDGIWGFHSDYANAWLDVDTLQANINASVTTFTGDDVGADDVYGQPSRISPGHLVKIDDEYMEVIRVEAGTNAVTVVRGANGTTEASHTAGAAISRWEVEEPVKRAVARQAGLLYARFGAYTTMELQAMGEIRYPPDWLAEVLNTLQGYAYG